MSDDGADLMLEILKGIQLDTAGLKRELHSLDSRMSAFEDHVRGLITSVYSMQADISDLTRVDRTETRLGLATTEQ